MPLIEIAIRNAVSKLFNPPLNEQQIKGVIRRFDKLIEEGHAEDYSFVMATERYKHRQKHA